MCSVMAQQLDTNRRVISIFFALNHTKWISRHLFEASHGKGVVRAFVHGAMDRRIDPSWGGLIELCLVQASAP